MASTSTLSKGITVTYSGFSLSVIDVDGPSIERMIQDITHQGTTGYGREFAGGLVDYGEINMTCWWDGNSQAAFVTAGDASSLVVVFQFSPTRTWTCNAVMKAEKVSAALGDRMKADVTFQLSGTPAIS